MIKPLVTLSLALSLGACVPVAEAPATVSSDATPTAAAAPAVTAYMAMGTEPGWTVEITPATLNYNGDYGKTQIIVPNPGAKPSFNGERYVTERLNVDVTHVMCNDGMSDRRYADTVMVSADGKDYQGCGGTILPPANLAGTQWTILSINGKDVVASPITKIGFDGARMSGNAGCNRFSGSYSSDGKRMTAGPIMSTRMACTDTRGNQDGGSTAMAQEQAFFALLNKPISLRFTPEGRLVLVGVGGNSAVLAPVE